MPLKMYAFTYKNKKKKNKLCFSSNDFRIITFYNTYYKFRTFLSPEMHLKVAIEHFD
jgi:hypothetical protein